MKKLLSIVIASLFAISTQAQNSPATTPSTTTVAPEQVAPANVNQAPQAAPVKAAENGVIMRDGKVWVIKEGRTTLLTSDMTLLDGTKVMADGTYMTRDGKKAKLENGDSIGLDGKVLKASQPKADPNK